MEKCLKSHTERLVVNKAKSSEVNSQHVNLGDPAQGVSKSSVLVFRPFYSNNYLKTSI